ncbi:MAG: ATP-binding cassette domain-containing protein [Acetobacteraceae bacterium]
MTAQASAEAIRFRGISKTYGTAATPLLAVQHADFAVAQGEFVAILGPSGCGKSTLLMMAAGLEQPTTGTVDVAGTPLAGPRGGTGVMFQDATLLPWMTVLDNVLFPATIQRRPRAAVQPRALELIRTMGLAGFEARRPHELSGGMRQRVAICRALVLDPRLAADGRAVQRAGRDHPRRDGRGAAGFVAAPGEDGDLRHSQHPRGGAAGGPHPGDDPPPPRPWRGRSWSLSPGPATLAWPTPAAFTALCAALRGMIAHGMTA